MGIVSAARPRSTQPNKKESSKKERPKLALVQTGVVHLRLRDVSPRALASALNTAAHPFGSFRPSGYAPGALDPRWKGSPRDADIAFIFDLNPPLRPAPGELPVTSTTQVPYR